MRLKTAPLLLYFILLALIGHIHGVSAIFGGKKQESITFENVTITSNNTTPILDGLISTLEPPSILLVDGTPSRPVTGLLYKLTYNCANHSNTTTPLKIYDYGIALIDNDDCRSDAINFAEMQKASGVIIANQANPDGIYQKITLVSPPKIPVYQIAFGFAEMLKSYLNSMQNGSLTNDSRPTSQIRVKMEPSSKGFPGIWEFTLIVVVVLFAVTCATSVAMHCHLYRLRRRQRSRDLATHASRPYGLKILSLTHEMLDKLPVRIYTAANRTDEEQGKILDDGMDNMINEKDELKDGKEKEDKIIDESENDGKGKEKGLQQDEQNDGLMDEQNDGLMDMQKDGQLDIQKAEERMENKDIKEPESEEGVGEHREDDKPEKEQTLTDSDKEDQTSSQISPTPSSPVAESSKSETLLSRRISMRSVRSTRSTKSERSLRAVVSASALASGQGVSGSGVSEGGQGYSETCAICLEDFDDGDELRQLPCGHEYHKECVDPWLLEKSSQCPLCKRDCFPDSSPLSSNASLPQSAFASISSANNVYSAILSWSPIVSLARSLRKVRNVVRRRRGVRWMANEGENDERLPEPVTAVPSSEGRSTESESRRDSEDYRNVRAESIDNNAGEIRIGVL